MTALNTRHDDEVKGQPRLSCAMLNCLIGFEDYLRAHTGKGCSIVNLRAGIYSGQRMHLGLLPWLLSENNRLPYIIGQYGYLPIIDGRDIGQAFARAALAPELSQFTSLNIVGPEVPPQQAVFKYIQQNHSQASWRIGLPSRLSHPLYNLLGLTTPPLMTKKITPTLSHMLHNPLINNALSFDNLGYDPTIGWKASIQALVADMNSSANTVKPLESPIKPLRFN